MKKITKLFIFLFFVHFSCEDQQSTDEGCKGNCDFNLRVFSDLPAGENADYKLEWVDSNTQTFGTIKADLGCEVIKKSLGKVIMKSSIKENGQILLMKLVIVQKMELQPQLWVCSPISLVM